MTKKNGTSGGSGALTAQELRELEQQVAEAGKNGIAKVLDKHFVEIERAQEKYALSNKDLISSTLTLNKEVAKSLRERVVALQANLRASIEKTADLFEVRAFKSVEDAIAKMKLSRFQLERVRSIADAQRTIHRSYQSIRFALQVFVALNRDLLDEIERARRENEERVESDLLLKNAILVYELADTIVKMLEGFELHGRAEFQDIKKEVLSEIQANKLEDDALARQCDGPNVDVRLREQTRQLVTLREQNRTLVNQAWSDQERKIGELERQARSIKQQVANLKLIRDNAKNQLGFLQLLTITQMMRHNLDAVQGLLAIDEIPLAPLTPDDVCRLLNIEVRGTLPPA